jgi:hypothetical protein
MGYKKRTVAKTGEITDEIVENVPENMPEVMPEVDDAKAEVSLETRPTTRAEINDEDAIMKRKLEIAEKRRASLALARSKIIPKSTLKKQVEEAAKATQEVIKGKDEVIKIKQEETDAMRLKYERERVKQLEESLNTLQKLIADKPAPVVPAPVVVEPVKEKYKRPSRAKSAMAEKHDVPSRPERTTQPQQIIPKKSIDQRIARPVPTETLIDKSYGEQLQERLRTQAIHKIMNDTFGGF